MNGFRMFPQKLLDFVSVAKSSQFAANIGWNILGKMSAKAIGPIFGILVARLLLPEDYGVYGIAMAFMAFLTLSQDLGMRQAIIIAQETEDWCSIQFTIQLIMAGVIYLLLFILSPHIAQYFQIVALATILKILGLGLFIGAVEDPLLTYYLREQNYRLIFFRQIIPSIAFGLTALFLAFWGAGVYSLVLATLISNFLTALFLVLAAKKKLRMYFPVNLILRLFRVGKHILFQQFCGLLVLQADALIVGKNLGPVNVGIYRMGSSLAQILPHTLIPQIQQVFFTEMARHKDNVAYLNRRYGQFMYSSGMITLPLSIVIVFLFPHIIPFLLGAKWTGVIPVAQIISVSLPTGMMVGVNNDLSKILNFNHVYSYFSIIRSVATVAAVIIGSQYSLHTMIVSWVIVGIAANLVNYYIFFKYQKVIKRQGGHMIMLATILLWAAFVLFTIQF